MKQHNCCMIMVAMFSLMLPCVANDTVQTAAKNVLENMSGKNIAKLYKTRTEAENPDQREVIVQACISGLYAIGDSKNAKKINQGLNRDEFIKSLMQECDLCHGAGYSQESCCKCKGSGACQNRKCSNGTVMGVGFDGRSNARKCSNCGGSGKCANCKGAGKIARTCSRCNGSKRIIGKEVALASCRDMLHALIDFGSEVQSRKKAEGASQLARQMLEREKQDREKAETDARLAEQDAENEKRQRENAEESSRLAQQRYDSERRARAKAEGDVRLAQQNAENEKLARVKAEEDARLAEQKATDEKVEREKAEETARLARVKTEDEKLAREKAESDMRLAQQSAEKEKCGRVRAEKDARLAEQNAKDEKLEREKAEESARLARIKAEDEKLAREKAEEDSRHDQSVVEKKKHICEKVEPEKVVAEKGRSDYSEDEVDKFKRSHSFTEVERQIYFSSGTYFTFQIRALPNGGSNTIIWEKRYEAQKSIELYKLNGDIEDVAQSSVEIRPTPGSARLSIIKTVVFNGDVGKVFGAFRLAFHKAYEWIELGKKNGTTPSEPIDMDLEVPDGCAVEIPGAADAWYEFNRLASSPDLVKMKSLFKFWFSDKTRVLRFTCGDVSFDFRWDVGQDEKLTDAESACDERKLLQLYVGRAGEFDLFRADQKYSKIPSARNSSTAPKWEGFVGDATLKLPNGMMVGLLRCSDDSFNYFFSPYYNTKAYLTTALIFPGDNYDDAYHAIEEAFRTALAWKSVAQRHHVLNIVKEMVIPCPKSAPVAITGTKGVSELLWKNFGSTDQFVLPTRFWFSVETKPTPERGGWVFKQKDSKYGIYFGNALVTKCIPINDSTIAAFSSLNPQLALRAIEAALRNKAKGKSIFK